jgi:hypothetical protein
VNVTRIFLGNELGFPLLGIQYEHWLGGFCRGGRRRRHDGVATYWCVCVKLLPATTVITSSSTAAVATIVFGTIAKRMGHTNKCQSHSND